MTSILKNYSVVLHAFIFAIISVSWFFNGSAYRSLQSVYIEYNSDYIEDMQVGFEDNKVALTIKVKHPVSCKKVISDLGINNIIVGANTYRPTCVIIDQKIMRVVYIKINEL